ncbi:MAG: hypothetical protein KGL39_37360 [Patescibacteria group bacterium]|nr:hypothetical protein [Patescibacteria group bacterium]
MALALSVLSVDTDLRKKEVVVKAVASGNYATGGDTVDLTAVTNPSNRIGGFFGYPGTIEDNSVEQGAGGYTAELVPGTSLSNWKLKIYSAPGTELAAGAYPAAITGDSFTLRFRGPKLQL